ncbi:hypothetical protein K1718_09630 [Roseibium porphyridii]|uniref:Uncharacterized protein n=1 Tax=Roseibium porphyridii TaxID=2866279 RepID=A0ABY8F7W7_9HYPH|nr:MULTISPECIES: hypothetical protein [Stappiaceae]QFT30980.1 hypothetical protein FIV00_10870 [Labrenzia sp. THAF82]WFE91598.1 hypothetical protein K1718_09630 [Roseibium sp. KMA01]
MDEIIMRRLKHLQRLEENHARDFEDRFGTEPSRKDQQRDALNNVISADWNRKQKSAAGGAFGRPLPAGWRKEHWKTQQAMAADYAGVKADNKEEAVRALEGYEAEMTLPPAA